MILILVDSRKTNTSIAANERFTTQRKIVRPSLGSLAIVKVPRHPVFFRELAKRIPHVLEHFLETGETLHSCEKRDSPSSSA